MLLNLPFFASTTIIFTPITHNFMPGAAKKRPAPPENNWRRREMQKAAETMQTEDVSTNAVALPSTPYNVPNGEHFDSVIRIKVEEDDGAAVFFDIHKGVLKFYSRYFQVAIKNIEEGHFAESADNMITLPDEEPEVFNAFKNWLYIRKLPVAASGTTDALCSVLVKLWCFGDRREIPLLQNECINRLLNVMESTGEVATEQLPYIYEHTIIGSPLRRLIIDLSSRLLVSTSSFEAIASSWDEESLRDLAKALVLRPKLEGWYQQINRKCDWHVHEKGMRC